MAQKSELFLRIASAVVLAPIVLAAVWLGGIYFSILMFLITAIAAYEYAIIMGKFKIPEELQDTPKKLILVEIFAPIACIASALILNITYGAAGLILCAFVLYMAVLMERRPNARGYGLGILYTGAAGLAFLWLRKGGIIDGETADIRGLGLTIFMLIVIWSTDTAAYFGGKSIGGPKIAPKISPKKTWAGLVSGMLGAAIFGGIFAHFMGAGKPIIAAGLAALLAIIAQAGDFFESHLKRNANIKDSGKIIPGHGGILDRIDGLMFSVPLLALFDAFFGAKLGWW